MPSIEEIITLVNGWGPYQFSVIAITLMSTMLNGYLEMLPVWVFRVSKHRCLVSDLERQFNNSEILELSIPYDWVKSCESNQTEKVYDQCLEKNVDWSSYLSAGYCTFDELMDLTSGHNYQNISCRSGEYVFEQTEVDWNDISIPTEYNLVCESLDLANWMLAAYSIGAALQGLFLAHLADLYGRSFMITIALCVQGMTCFLLAWLENVYVLIVLFGILGLFTTLTYQVGIVYVIEIVDSSHKSWSGSWSEAAYAFGIMLIGIVGYFMKYWRFNFLWVSIVSLILAGIRILFSDETLYFYHILGCFDKCYRLMLKIAKRNRVELAGGFIFCWRNFDFLSI